MNLGRHPPLAGAQVQRPSPEAGWLAGNGKASRVDPGAAVAGRAPTG